MLPFLGRYGLNSGCERLVSRGVNRPVFDSCASRVFAKKVVVLPIPRGPDGSGHESAATVWTDIAQYAFYAGCTKRTFIGADAGLKGVGWQSFVAMLAGRSEFQHGGSFYVERPA